MSKAELFEAVQRDFSAENGTEEAPEHKLKHKARNGRTTFDSGCAACRAGEDTNVLRQKYGLMAPQPYEGTVRKLNGKEIRVNENRVISLERQRLAKEFARVLVEN